MLLIWIRAAHAVAIQVFQPESIASRLKQDRGLEKRRQALTRFAPEAEESSHVRR